MNYELRIKKTKDAGFTIIETMIAVSLYLVIVMYGMNSLMQTTNLNKKSQDMRSIMDGLSFSMEEMSRNLRTGYEYHCVDDGNYSVVTPHGCPYPIGGAGISFKTTSGAQWMYKISSVDGTNYGISKSTDGGATWIALTSSEISLNQYSGFFVSGALLGPADNTQPFINIKLVGKITSKNNIVSPFSLQTSVSQRTADITP